MSDPLRFDDSRTLDAASNSDRDPKIEQLLLVGLDHYFAGQYEDAINVWTRVLFLDRGHARARAYIERARTAMAERLRAGDELVHRGLAAFDRGDVEEAHRLLDAAVVSGASQDDVHGALSRIGRLSQAIAAPVHPVAARGTHRAIPGVGLDGARKPSRAGLWIAFLAVLLVGLALATKGLNGWARLGLAPISLSSVLSSLGFDMGPRPVPLTIADPVLPVPRHGEIVLTRAHALAAAGHLHEALATLDTMRPTDPQWTDGEQMRSGIQRQLLDLPAVGTPAAPGELAGPGDGRPSADSKIAVRQP